MAMHSQLKALLKQTITIEPFSSRSDANEFTYSASSSVAARVQQKVTVIKDESGRDVVSHTQIYVDGDTTVTKNDRITLPDSTQPQILAIYSTPDESGTTYYKCIYT